MTEKGMPEALNAIHDEVLKLLNLEEAFKPLSREMREEVTKRLMLIVSITRYGMDVRWEGEAAE